jgi:hypothetical protein
LLESLREGDDGSNKPYNKLSEYEMTELMQRGGVGHGFEMQELDERDKADRVGGIGHEQRTKSNKRWAPNNDTLDKQLDMNKLEGIGVDDLKHLDTKK